MFLKAADKKDKNTGKMYRYYKLCESYRIGNKVRHRTVQALGKLEELENDNERKILADRIEQLLTGGNEMFPVEIPVHVDKLAVRLSRQIKQKGLLQYAKRKPVAEVSDEPSDLQMVDLNSVASEEIREIGTEWLCKQALEELGLGDFLLSQGWDKSQVDIALMHIISRAAFPASEHKTAEWIHDNSAVTELFNISPESINRFHLYKASSMLYKQKGIIEGYLSRRTNEIFDLEDKIILYDLTNTYFEGRKVKSKIAKFGRSKEKRSDAKIVALAVVVNVEGFIKYSHIYEGNIADCTTLKDTIAALAAKTSDTGRKPTVVIDAGIATEDNLKALREDGYRYICVSRTRLKDYQINEDDLVHIEDNREHKINISWVKNDDEDQDNFLYVHSLMKEAKETSMNDHFCGRFEEELSNMDRQLQKNSGRKSYGTIMERLGRIKERYPAANKHYKINVSVKNGVVIGLTWQRKVVKSPSNEGVYFIRTNYSQVEEKLVWDIYNTIRQIEATFRVLKSDLHLRPVFHKKDENTMAHLYLGILAYMVVHTIRFRLAQNGIHHDWQNIRRIMSSQHAVTTSLVTEDKRKIHIRTCSKPITGVREIYTAMGYKPMPFHRRKYVFPEFRNRNG
jgi:hypothetical protein